MRDHASKYACCEIRSYFCLVQVPQQYQDSQVWEERLGMQNGNRLFVEKFYSPQKQNF